MNPARLQLIKGAVKSGLAALSGVTVGVNFVDPAQFSVMTWPGIMHTLIVGAITVAVAEARYFKQWVEKWSDS